MKILIVSDVYLPGVGGVQVAIHTLMEGLRRSGDDVMLVTGSERGLVRPYEEVLDNGAIVYRLPSVPSPVNAKNTRFCITPDKYIRALFESGYRPDVVHFHLPFLWLHKSVLKYARLYNIPCIATNHVMPDNFIKNIPKLPGVKMTATQFFKQQNKTISTLYAVTAPTHAAVAQLTDVKTRKLAVSNGIDVDQHATTQDDVVSNKYHLPSDTHVLLYTGRLDGEKRVDIVIDAMSELTKHRTDIHLFIVGSGKFTRTLKRQMVRLGLSDYITFTGFVSFKEKCALMHRADVFIMPSPTELQCLAALEAMVAKTPVVVANRAALPELLNDGQNGIAFDFPSPHSCAQAIARLLDDPGQREAMARNACEWTKAHHAYTHTVNDYKTIYKEASYDNE